MTENNSQIARVILETPNKEVLLIRRASGTFAGKWEIPGGKINNGESLEEGVIRETREETGIVIDTKDLVDLFPDGIRTITSQKSASPDKIWRQLITGRIDIQQLHVIRQKVFWAPLNADKKTMSELVQLGNEHNRVRLINQDLFVEQYATEKFTDLTRASLSKFFARSRIRSRL